MQSISMPQFKTWSKRIFVSLAIALNPIASLADAPMVEDFSQLSSLAAQKNIPVMLVFNAEHCEYCERLANEQINPLLITGEYQDKLIIRQLRIDRYNSIQDFSGEKVSVSDFVDRYEVGVTPTVMLFDHKGRVLTKKLVGYQNRDFYSFYLEEAIQNATNKLR